ncbi:MAG TPA: amino acid permease [Vicinamibacterales bacterium]|jgi:APA family basic amino acid/polyamine antiporter|nr:amino acid permease [Vicinamibacterales bacterium]
MTQLFRRKPIAELVVEGDQALKRVMGAGDLIMLAIGAVIGAGIFGAIGTAAAGQIGPNGEVIRQGAGPALVFSFLLLGVACALAGLCYAELAAMIPQAGSAYAYSYATLGELVAWIIGWDLILEYAVGNVAVAISWGDYFNTLLRGFGWTLPPWLTTGYRTALLSADPAIHGLLNSAPHVFGIPILVHVPAFSIVMLITWLLLQGARESSTANNIMVVIKLMALALFIAVGATHLHAANYHPFAPNGFTGIHQGAAIVFFAYIGFDAISTAAEETKDPQRNLPIGILGGLAICTVIYIIVGAVLTGMVPYQQLAVADPLARALELAGFKAVGWIVALGAAVSMSAVLLVFQYGQPRIFFAMARDGLLPQWAARLNAQKIPATTTLVTGVFVATWSLIGDAGETYDLTNIGTLFAFMLVSIGVLVLRYKEPERPRPFRVPFVWPVTLLSAAGCVFIMRGLPHQAWERFGYWLAIGLVLYFLYGFQNSRLRGHQRGRRDLRN